MDLAKLKIVQRAKKALELSTICQGEMIVKHSTSSNDVATALCHVSTTEQRYGNKIKAGHYMYSYKFKVSLKNYFQSNFITEKVSFNS